MKSCFKCGEEKPMDEFYKHPKMGDGRLGKCKECARRDVRVNRRRKAEYYAEYDRKRGNRLASDYLKKHRDANPGAYRARAAVGNALRNGKLQKEPCFFCGVEENLHAHHHDYTKPLDVTWLCVKCHRRLHAYLDKTETQVVGHGT